MQLTCWGARGTFPIAHPACQRFGGNTPCLELEWENGDRLIVDAGTGFRSLGQKMMRQDRLSAFTLILTHLHWDHIIGFPYFLPFYFFPVTCNIYGNPTSSRRLNKFLSIYSQKTYLPINRRHFKTQLRFGDCPTRGWRHDGYSIIHHRLSHPGGSLGLRFRHPAGDVVFCTDNELGLLLPHKKKWRAMIKFAAEARILIHDATYTDEEYRSRVGWGHSTASQAATLAQEAGVNQLYLYHHDPERSDTQVEDLVRRCRAALPSTSRLKCAALAERDQLKIT